MSNAPATRPTNTGNDEPEKQHVNEVIRMWAEQKPELTQRAVDTARRTNDTAALQRFREAGII